MAYDHKDDKKGLSISVEKTEVSKAVEKSYKKYANGFQRPSVLLDLEPRMMFDGAAPAVVDDIVDAAAASAAESLPNPSADSNQQSNDTQSSSADSDTSSPQASDSNDESELSLFDQLTNNSSSDLIADPAAGLDAENGDFQQSQNLESTLDDLFIDDAQLEDEVQAQSAVSDNATSEAQNQFNNFEEQEAFDYTDDSDIDRVVFFDTTVGGYEDLLEGLINDLKNPDAESLTAEHIVPVDVDAVLETAAANDDTLYVNGVAIHLLQDEEGQIEQITDTLSGYTELSAIDIISHGAAGEIQLGNQRLNNENLDSYADSIAQWGDALSANGDILLYGCNVGEHGQEFIENIAELTSADVAGSDDLTGNAEFGGDFSLEVIAGLVEAPEIITAQNATAFAGVLADTDGDGIDDGTDLDSDNDGILDADEGFVPLTTVTTLTDAGPAGVVPPPTHEGALITAADIPTGELNADATDSVSLQNLYGGTTNIDVSLNGTGMFNDGVQIQDLAGQQVIFTQPQFSGETTLIDATFDIDNPGNATRYEYSFNGDVVNFQFSVGGLNNADAVRVFAFLDGVQVPLDLTNIIGNVENPGGNGAAIMEGAGTDDSIFVTSPNSAGGAGIDTNVVTFEINENVDQVIVFTGKSDGTGGNVTLGFTGISVTATVDTDTDGDGINDHLDLDSDNDGISDLVESGADFSVLDGDGNGIIEGADADSDGVVDANAGGTALVDNDVDGIDDFRDLDSDNDGICLLYTSPSPRDLSTSRMPSSA